MKVLAIQGSPRKKGNTATILKHYLQGVAAEHPDWQIEVIKVAKQNIQSCKGCDGCRDPQGKCVIKDDMQEIYPQIIAADILVMASPVYWWSITAQAKQFLDRFYAINYGDHFKGKKFVLLLTYADADPNSGAEITRKMFQEICSYLGMDFIQFYGLCTGEVEAVNNQEALSAVNELGKVLLA